MLLINCEVSLIWTGSENCVITSKAYKEEIAGDSLVTGINNLTEETFKITDTKLHVPIMYFINSK